MSNDAEHKPPPKPAWDLVGTLVSDGVVVVDTSGQFLYVSPEAERIAGLGATHKPMEQWPEHYGTFRLDGVTPVRPEELPLVRAMHGETVRDSPLVLRNPGVPDGVAVSASATPLTADDGSLLGAVLAIRDITEAVNFRSMVERSPDAMLVHRRGAIVYTNPAFDRILGHASPGDLVGRPVIETIIHPEDRELVRDRMKRTESGEDLGTKAVRCLRADGTSVHVEGHPQPVVFDGRRSVLVILRDITERVRLSRQLVVSERMSSLGTLAAGIAHEINNPLAYILANLEHLTEELEDIVGSSPSARLRDLISAVTDVRSGAERIRRIVRGLRTMSRANDELPEPLDLHRVLDVAVNMTSNEIRHRAVLDTSYRDVPMVNADEAQLVQVFVNLLVNAAQAIREGNAQRNKISVETFSGQDGRAVVQIRDTGHGIAEKFVPRIFDPFFTTKPPGVGTGLGLSVCHSLVTRWGGEIAVASDPPNGTTFRVTLPAATDPAPQRFDARPAVTPESKRGRVLIVDDDAMVGKSFHRVLGRQHHVVFAEDGAEALAILDRSPGFDVIFCDLMMPTMTGEQFFTKLARTDPALAARVVFITGALPSASQRDFLGAGHNECFEKPLDVATIRRIVDARLAADET